MLAHREELTQATYIVVQHLRKDTVAFVRAMREVGCRVAEVVGIGYSAEPGALAALAGEGIPFSLLPFADIPARLFALLDQFQSDDVVILDVGGYAAEVASHHSLARRLRCVVEDTNAGIWRYRELVPVCPIVDVASIMNKMVENCCVGGKIVDGCLKALQENGLGVPMGGVVVLGFGGIGRNVCDALRKMGTEPYVVETEPRALAIATALGYEAAPTVRRFRKISVIIGCTGVASIGPEDLDGIDGPICLVSGSSKAIEFSRFSEGGTLDLDLQRQMVTWLDGGRICLLNGGRPINFVYGSLTDDISDFMFGNIVGGIIEGLERRGGAVQQLSEEWQRRICQSWVQFYLGS